MAIKITNKKSHILIILLLLISGLGLSWAAVETYNSMQYNVVYLKSGGTGNGDSADSPVGTWAAAYKKLTNTGNRDYDWEHNIIVVLGEMQLKYAEGDTKDKANKKGTPATITGVWPWENPTSQNIKNGGKVTVTGSSDNKIGADVRFKNLVFKGSSNTNGDRMSLRLHNALFDTGLIMQNFAALGTGYGMIQGRNAPAFHIQLSFDHFGSNRGSDVKYEMPDNKEMTVIFKSGKYGRVAVSRAQGTTKAVVESAYIQGTPEHPVMAHIIMDIQDGNDNSGNYADDIGILLGGSSQGLVCADLQFDINQGTIGTLVAGAQGNNIAGIEGWKIPQGTFAGRTIINLNGNKDGSGVRLQNLYVGTQGRTGSTGTNGTAYFYGQSILNMYGGTIESGVFSSAAAFCGLGNETNHTQDYAIPYVNANNELTFSSYSKNSTMATIKSTFNGNVDLSTSTATMNIFGGIINGGVYGGSRGYDQEVKPQYAPAGAGSFYGETRVNIYGGTINGGVYGGGLGVSTYYENSTYGGKEGYLNVAQVYGNTNVNIYGGDIRGDIYGGGAGVRATSKNEYINIAKVYGNTNVTINPQILKDRAQWTNPDVPEFSGPNINWTFNHNIYGGGAMGAVEGNTNVKILGGTINGNVFGAGQGEEGHPDKAKVTGNANVTVGESL